MAPFTNQLEFQLIPIGYAMHVKNTRMFTLLCSYFMRDLRAMNSPTSVQSRRCLWTAASLSASILSWIIYPLMTEVSTKEAKWQEQKYLAVFSHGRLVSDTRCATNMNCNKTSVHDDTTAWSIWRQCHYHAQIARGRHWHKKKIRSLLL